MKEADLEVILTKEFFEKHNNLTMIKMSEIVGCSERVVRKYMKSLGVYVRRNKPRVFGKIKVNCGGCGNEIEIYHYKIEQSKTGVFFCSKDCTKGKTLEESYGEDAAKKYKKNFSLAHETRDPGSYKRQGRTLSKNRKEQGGLNHKEGCTCCICKTKRGETFGEDNNFFGKHQTEGAIRRAVEGNRKRYADGTHGLCDPARRLAQVRASQKTLFNRKGKTSYEAKIQEIIEENNFPYRYTGNSDFWLQSEGKHINPDFISTDGSKIALEPYASYFKIKVYGSVENYRVERTRLLWKLGWKVIYFDEKDLNGSNWKEHCLNKILIEQNNNKES